MHGITETYSFASVRGNIDVQLAPSRLFSLKQIMGVARRNACSARLSSWAPVHAPRVEENLTGCIHHAHRRLCAFPILITTDDCWVQWHG